MAESDRSHPDSIRLNDALAEIEGLKRRRADLDPEDFSEMLEIKEQTRDLQIKAAELRASIQVRSTPAEARAELETIERRLAEITTSHVNVVSQAGGGSAGGDFGFAIDAHKLNRQIDEASGRTALETRARHLRSWLEEQESPE